MSEVVTLNVGGTTFRTTRGTLRGSAMLDGLIGTEGEHFIDRDPTLFPVILNRLRGSSCEACISATPHGSLAQLQHEADFYGVDVFGDFRVVDAQGVCIRVHKSIIKNCFIFNNDRKEETRRVFHVAAPAKVVAFMMDTLRTVTFDRMESRHMPTEQLFELIATTGTFLYTIFEASDDGGGDREPYTSYGELVTTFYDDKIDDTFADIERQRAKWTGMNEVIVELKSISQSIESIPEYDDSDVVKAINNASNKRKKIKQ